MAQTQPKTWSEADYWAFEETSKGKHEFINGKLYAMAGGTLNHATLCGNIFAAAKARLRGKPCKAATSELKVKVAATGDSFYPDTSIYCPPARFEGKGDHTLLTPVVLFEVLSPKTKEFDREGKLLFYEKIETLTDYVLVDAERIFVEHWSRATPAEDWRWRAYTRRTDVLQLPHLELELPLEEIYEELEMIEDWVAAQLAKHNGEQ